jgi:error-prone DNA polymerase
MATFRRMGTIDSFRDKFVTGMAKNGYAAEYAGRCFQQIEGFGDYGFPMSHAASFALLVYVSAWLKRHYPDVFCAAILNSQPMGFYAPAQLVRDARDHGVEVRPPDINASHWDCILEEGAVRLGFRQIGDFREADASAIVAARGRFYDGVHHLASAANLPSDALMKLADADAFRSVGLDRRQALWVVKGLDGGAESSRTVVPELPLFAGADPETLRMEDKVELPPLGLGEHIIQDYATLRLSLKQHPLALLRPYLSARGVVRNAELASAANSAHVRVAGLVLVRQRPGTAKGVTFATLEDETGVANLVVWQKIFEAYRRPFLASRLMMVSGRLQREGLVVHVVAEKIDDLSHELYRLSDSEIAPASETKRQAHRHPRNAPARLIPKSRDFR